MKQATAAELGRKLLRGTLDPIALTEQILEAIAASGDPAIFIDVLDERARTEAKAARRRQKGGTAASLLDGVPVGWKDLFDIEGRATTAGSVVLKGAAPAQADAALVAAGKRAGLITVGTLNMTEFAYSGIGLNPHYGTPRNPHGGEPARAPGGSSSGSGVAVAKGILPVAIGTDTGGSVRIPASFNGVVGYKSSTGHYPMEGVFPLSRTLDTLGPLAQTVEDCALLDAALRGLPQPRARKQPLSELTILVPENVVRDGLDPAVEENFEAALSRIAKHVASVRKIKFPVFDAIQDLFQKRGHILAAEALHVHWDRVHGPEAARMDARVVSRIRMAEKMTAVDLVEIMERRRKLIAECNDLIGSALVACPTTPNVAMPIAPLEVSHDVFFAANAKTLRNTTLGNFLDWCGVAIPSGFDQAGMPTSLLISAPHGHDTQVLSAGLSLESLIRG